VQVLLEHLLQLVGIQLTRVVEIVVGEGVVEPFVQLD